MPMQDNHGSKDYTIRLKDENLSWTAAEKRIIQVTEECLVPGNKPTPDYTRKGYTI